MPVGEIVDILLMSAAREAVAETVDVRLTVIDRVLVGLPVDVLDCARLRVGDTVMNGVRVPLGESVPVELRLELTELVVEAVCDFD